MVGTEVYSAPGLVSLMQSWVESDTGSVMIQSSRLHLDPTCYTKLDTLFANDCVTPVTPVTTPPYITASVKPPTAAPVNSSISAGEIGGIAVGVVIVLLLIILIVVIILKKWRPKVIRR